MRTLNAGLNISHRTFSSLGTANTVLQAVFVLAKTFVLIDCNIYRYNLESFNLIAQNNLTPRSRTVHTVYCCKNALVSPQ